MVLAGQVGVPSHQSTQVDGRHLSVQYVGRLLRRVMGCKCEVARVTSRDAQRYEYLAVKSPLGVSCVATQAPSWYTYTYIMIHVRL